MDFLNPDVEQGKKSKSEKHKADCAIAEFMGGKLVPSTHMLKYWIWMEGYNPDSQVKFMEKQLRFRESFDWIMAVMDKIEKMKFQSAIIYNIEDKEYVVSFPKAEVRIVDKDKKVALWKAVVEWIEWYNINKNLD